VNPGEIAIERGCVDDVAALRELWLELHHHHQEVAAQSGEFTDDESSWRVRSTEYRQWLDDPRSFLLLARSGLGQHLFPIAAREHQPPLPESAALVTDEWSFDPPYRGQLSFRPQLSAHRTRGRRVAG
jgi:hypothetical protein